MTIQISLSDLGSILLGLALLILIIYAIYLLKNLIDIIKVFRKILQENQSNINQVLKQAPSIAQNIENISSDLSHDLNSVQKTFDQIIGSTEIAAASLTKNKNILSNIISISQVIYSLKGFISNFPSKNNSKTR